MAILLGVYHPTGVVRHLSERRRVSLCGMHFPYGWLTHPYRGPHSHAEPRPCWKCVDAAARAAGQ